MGTEDMDTVIILDMVDTMVDTATTTARGLLRLSRGTGMAAGEDMDITDLATATDTGTDMDMVIILDMVDTTVDTATTTARGLLRLSLRLILTYCMATTTLTMYLLSPMQSTPTPSSMLQVAPTMMEQLFPVL